MAWASCDTCTSRLLLSALQATNGTTLSGQPDHFPKIPISFATCIKHETNAESLARQSLTAKPCHHCPRSRYWSLHENRYLRYMKGHRAKVIGLEVSPSQDLVLSASVDATVRLWDVRSDTCSGLLNLQHKTTRPAVSFDDQVRPKTVIRSDQFRQIFSAQGRREQSNSILRPPCAPRHSGGFFLVLAGARCLFLFLSFFLTHTHTHTLYIFSLRLIL
jgi:WD40 repeat protein